MKRILTIKILTVVTLATGVFAQSSQPQTQPATSNTIRAGALTPEQIRQEAKEKQQKAEDERLARQIEHAKKQVEAAEKRLDDAKSHRPRPMTDKALAEEARLFKAIEAAKARLAELEAKAKERGLTTSTSPMTEDPAALKAEVQKLKAENERLKAENAKLKRQLAKAG